MRVVAEPTAILVGATAAELVRDEFHLRSVARVQVKGKTKPVDAFTFIGARNEDVDPQLLKWIDRTIGAVFIYLGLRLATAEHR